jgi:diguanylate cyclase (GGDEF)-like protein
MTRHKSTYIVESVGEGSLFRIRRSFWVGAALFVMQGVVLAGLREGATAAVLSDSIQLALGCLLVVNSILIARSSAGWYRHFWQLHATSFTLWCVAQGIGVYQDVHGASNITVWASNLLFCFWFVPLAMALFFDSNDRGEGFDWLLALDFCQGVLACVASYLYFFYLPRAEAPTDLAHSVWAPYFVVYAIIVSAFLIRSSLSTSRMMQSLFGRLGILLAVSGVADALYYYGRLGAIPGGWFDMFWSSLLLANLLLPSSEKRTNQTTEEALQPAIPIRSFIAVQLFPLLLAVCTLVMSSRIARESLGMAAAVVLACFVCFSARLLVTHYRLLATQEALRREATHDGLTGLWSHKTILQILDRELLRSQRSGTTVSIMMADLDHFKSVNDSLGHAAGDEVLRMVAKELAGAVRPYDSVGRYGGEEFLIVAPECGVEDARVLAERIRAGIAQTQISMNGRGVTVTISLGTATRASGNAEELLLAADQALYRAKISGRNRVEIELGRSAMPATAGRS